MRTLQFCRMSKYKYISFSEIDYAVKMNNCSFLNVCISTFFVQARHGVKVKSFKCLPDLIDHFKKPDKGLAIRLRYPVERSKAMNEDNENTYESMIKCYVLFLIIPISSIWWGKITLAITFNNFLHTISNFFNCRMWLKSVLCFYLMSKAVKKKRLCNTF